MKQTLLLLLIAITSLHSYGQVAFEKGYYINNANQVVNCDIKNLDWRNNPTVFEYRLPNSEDIKTAVIATVKEFGIENGVKYLRKTVNIDRSSDNLTNLSNDKNPQFEEEQIFLKTLIEGKASLYSYQEGNLIRYFYTVDGADVEQLIYKSYKTTNNKVGKNYRYRQQLFTNLKCSNIKISRVENLAYQKTSLVNFISDYNSCNNSDFTNYEKKEKRDLFNLSIRPHLRSSSLSISNVNTIRNTDFDNKTNIGLGIEAEFILPFNNNKWAFAIEPTYQSFKTKGLSNDDVQESRRIEADVDYTSIELPLSLKYYIFLDNNSKIFLNAGYVLDFSSSSTIEFNRGETSSFQTLDIESGGNFALGLGYKFMDTYSIEFRYQGDRDLLTNTGAWKSEFQTIEVIFGYSIF